MAVTASTSTTPNIPSTSSTLAKLPIKRFAGHRERVTALAWNCDGRRLASGAGDKTVKIWLPEKDGRSATEMKGHSSGVTKIKWDPNHPELLASCSGTPGIALDKGLFFWDLRQAKPTSIVQTQGENLDMCWSPDGKTIVIGNRKDIKIWVDVDTKKVIKIDDTPDRKETNQSIFSHNGSLLFTAYDTGIKINAFPSDELVHSFQVSPAPVMTVDLDPRGRYIAVGGNDANITLWETTDLTCVTSIGTHDEPVRTCIFSHDGRYLASSASEGQAVITEVPSGKKLHSVSMNTIDAIAWHPSKTLLAFSSDEGRQSGGFGIWGNF